MVGCYGGTCVVSMMPLDHTLTVTQHCVDGYRESLRISREKRQISIITEVQSQAQSQNPITPSMYHQSPSRSQLSPESGPTPISFPSSHTTAPRLSKFSRAISSRLAHRGVWSEESQAERLSRSERAKVELRDGVWHLSESRSSNSTRVQYS
jgi:hypothetical protein